MKEFVVIPGLRPKPQARALVGDNFRSPTPEDAAQLVRWRPDYRGCPWFPDYSVNHNAKIATWRQAANIARTMDLLHGRRPR